MALSVSPRTYRFLDGTTKSLGLVAVVAGLSHLAGRASPLLVLGGIAVGVATVFVDVDESGCRDRSAGRSSSESVVEPRERHADSEPVDGRPGGTDE